MKLRAFYILTLLLGLSAVFSPIVSGALQVKSFPGVLKYRVKKGDSLWAISRRYHVSVPALCRANGLKDPELLKVGKNLQIPVDQDDYFNRELAVQGGIKYGPWKHIVVHHSATKVGNARRLDYYHRKIRHMPRGLAYHFLIGNGRGLRDGDIEVGPRWSHQQPGGHVRSESFNKTALGICLVGNFENQRPSRKQMDSLVALTRYLQKEFHIPRRRVSEHKEVKNAHTLCPGRYFPLRSFRKRLRP